MISEYFLLCKVMKAVIAKVGADHVGIRLSPYGTYLEVGCSTSCLQAVGVISSQRCNTRCMITVYSWHPLVQLLQYGKARCLQCNAFKEGRCIE